jgi:hypothetical protein
MTHYPHIVDLIVNMENFRNKLEQAVIFLSPRLKEVFKED